MTIFLNIMINILKNSWIKDNGHHGDVLVMQKHQKDLRSMGFSAENSKKKSIGSGVILVMKDQMFIKQ